VSLRYLRPSSLGQLGPGHNVIESSAGTGKTFLLEHLFVELVANHGIPAEQILVVTFTEKAAAELVLRVRRLLTELATLRPDHPKVVAAAAEPAADSWLIDERARGRLDEALLALPRVGISTIHAFCQRVLREHAFAQGRLFDEELVDGQAVFGEAWREVLRTHAATEPELRALLEAWLESGGSTAALETLLWECAEKDAESLRPHFDEARLAQALAAWRPVRSDDARLQQRLKHAGIHGRKVATVLDRLARISGIVESCRGDTLKFLARVRGEAGDSLGDALTRLCEGRLDDDLLALAGRVRELADAAVPLPAVAAQRLLPVVAARAARRKRGRGHYDYADMLGLVATALADPGPAGRELLATLRGRYRHGLIDEFQDTDRTQWQIFRRIFVEAEDGRHGLTVVGDPKQAIYGFRSADVHTYLEARDTLAAAGARTLALQVSYRATAPLIEATNRLFAQPGCFRPGGGIAYDRPVTCGRPERRLASTDGRPEPPVVLWRFAPTPNAPTADQLRGATSAAIVEEIRRLIGEASTVRRHDGGPGRPVELRDIFILTFTNRECHAVGEALGRAGIRHAFYKLGDLFASSEAEEIRDVLLAVATPADRDRRGKALLTRFFGLDLAALAALREAPTESPAVRLLRDLAELAADTDIPAFFSALVERTGVIRRELWRGTSERGLTNIMHVLELLQAEWARSRASLPELARLLDAYVRGNAAPPGHDSDLQRLETDENAVQILTIHKAKGLEADVVFLYGGLGGGRSSPVHVFHEDPGQRRALYVGKPEGDIARRVAEEQEDEQSRLHYVALTRARYRLYLPHYPPSFRHLSGPYRRLNRLVDEIAANPAAGSERLFEVRTVDGAAGADPRDGMGKGGVAEIPQDLLDTPAVPLEIAELRRTRAGFLVTSYSSVKRLRQGLAPADDDARGSEPEALAAAGPDHLPGGAATGIFLHELLAAVPLAGLAAMPAFADWHATVAPWFDRRCRRHARPAAHAALAARLVHAAYATPVRVGDRVVPGLASAEAALRELEFLYPMPEPSHPRLLLPAVRDGEGRWPIERGVVKGFVDFLFEHGGRIYVCDWKTDELPSYEAPLLARHCQQHYDVQARIYTLAALRLFGIARADEYAGRFGGVLYCFLRGRAEGDDRRGIYFAKPDWDEIVGWEREMEGQRFWGLAR
jgi:exodeoxyribonuclease V beta subunit